MTPRAWWLFALSSGVWGVPYLFIRVAVDAGVPPAFLAWSRVALGAALLVPLALRRGALRGLQGRGAAIAAYAACEIAAPFVLIAMGERYISSSLTAILLATMPLFVALLSVRLSPGDKPGERHYLHQPSRGGPARRRRAGRASWTDVRRRIGADSGRLVAVHRRAGPLHYRDRKVRRVS